MLINFAFYLSRYIEEVPIPLQTDKNLHIKRHLHIYVLHIALVLYNLNFSIVYCNPLEYMFWMR